jgi:hypothetical protein
MSERKEKPGFFSRLFRRSGGRPARPDPSEPALGVTWMLLPPYDIPGMAVVSGVLIENQGELDASDVHISLRYSGERPITHMEVVCDDPYEREGGSPRDSFVTIRLSRMRAGTKVVIYVAGHSVESPVVDVRVSRYLTAPEPAGEQQAQRYPY